MSGRSKSADAPAEVEKRKQRRATLGKIAACEKSDGGHRDADADSEQQKCRSEKEAGAKSNSEASADHCGEADGDESCVIAATQEVHPATCRQSRAEREGPR